jgi:hypothetical protein
MGRPDPNAGNPSRRGTLAAPVYELSWGSDPGTGNGWHSATEDGEHVTAAQWAAITAAAQVSAAAMDLAILATPASRAWSKAKDRAAAAGQNNLMAITQAHYAARHGAPLASVWVAG